MIPQTLYELEVCSPEEEKQRGLGGSDLSFHSLVYSVIQYSSGISSEDKVEDVNEDEFCCC